MSVLYIVENGAVLGVEANRLIKAALQRKQSQLYDKDFATELSKKIIASKISNQVTVLRRYSKSKQIDVDEHIFNMQNSKKKRKFHLKLWHLQMILLEKVRWKLF